MSGLFDDDRLQPDRRRLGFHIPKGYLYAAIGFSILIEVFNQLARSRRQRNLQSERPLRERTADAVLSLLGGRVEADQVGEAIVDLVGDGSSETQPFQRRERLMIRGVLNLAEQSVRTAMTDRMQVDRINLDQDRETIRQVLLESPHSRLPVIRGNAVDEPLGYLHKKELLNALLAGQEPDIEALLRTPLSLPESVSVLSALEQMRQASTHVAFVINELGAFEGMVTLTDILEAIAGELPDASEMDSPDIETLEGGYRVSGSMNLAVLCQTVGFPIDPTEEYQTLAGLVMSLLNRLPVVGDRVEAEGWEVSVGEVRDRRVSKVELRPLAAEAG